MPMKFRFPSLVIPLTIIVLAFATSLAAQNSTPQAGAAKRSITEKDLFNFIWIADPQVSPDGSRAAFTRVVPDEKRTGDETSIWMVATSGNEDPLRMTNGKHDVHPRWSPDGRRIAFVRGGEKDDAGKPRPPQIAILSLAGGEARIVTDLPEGAGAPVWSPDSRHIAFVSSTTPEDIEKEQRKKNDAKADNAKADNAKADNAKAREPGSAAPAPKAESEGDRESDIHIITRAVYRDNDEGYLDFKRHEHVWLIDLTTTSDELAKAVQLTSGDYDEGDVFWTHDSSRIYFLTTRIDEPYYETPSTDIYSVSSSPSAGSASAGAPERL